MSSTRMMVAGMLALALGGAGPARAGDQFSDRFGSLEQAKVCEKEYAESSSGGWGGNVYQTPQLVLDAIQASKLSSECKAEVDRRAQICATDKGMQSSYNGNLRTRNWGKDPVGWCTIQGYFGVSNILLNVAQEKAKEEAKKKKAEAEKARLAELAAKTVLPKPSKRDPGLEKQIAAAYKAAFPDNKVLKVILRDTGWNTERSSIGIITGRTIDATIAFQLKDGSCQLHHEGWWQGHNGKKFSATTEQRGAGSMQLEGILCKNIK